MKLLQKPHLYVYDYNTDFTWLQYTGNPKAMYGRIDNEDLNTRYSEHLCPIQWIKSIVITCEYLLINSTFSTFRIPHTEQTYSELQNIMEAHHNETV